MSCENWLPLIEEYLDGELNRKQAANVQSHIATCGICAAEYDLLKSEQELYSAYDRDLEPSPDMWLAVRTRIREEAAPTSGSFLSKLKEIAFGPSGDWKLSPAVAALLVIAAVTVTILVMRSVERRPGVQTRAGSDIARSEPAPNPTNSAEKTNQPNVPAPAPEGTDERKQPGLNPLPERSGAEDSAARAGVRNVRRAEVKPRPQTPQQVVDMAVQQNLLAIKVLTKEISKHRSDLDPMEVARFETTLRSIDRTIAETREAVRRHPNDPVAAKYMLDAYAQKVEIMRDMAGARPMSDEVAHPNR